MKQYCGTTILSVRRNGMVVIGGDGSSDTWPYSHEIQCPAKYGGYTMVKYWLVLLAAQQMLLLVFERFESKLETHQGNLVRAAVELAKDWRTDRILRRLEALLAVADAKSSLIITGNGDVVEPEHSLIAIGSGGPYAQSAAQALLENTEMDARSIVEKSLTIAAIFVFITNKNFTIETLNTE